MPRELRPAIRQQNIPSVTPAQLFNLHQLSRSSSYLHKCLVTRQQLLSVHPHCLFLLYRSDVSDHVVEGMQPWCMTLQSKGHLDFVENMSAQLPGMACACCTPNCSLGDLLRLFGIRSLRLAVQPDVQQASRSAVPQVWIGHG